MNDVEMREKQLNIRLSEEEALRLDAVAKHYGLNAAATFRMLVKREWDEIERSKTAPTPYFMPEEHKQVIGTLRRLDSISEEDVAFECDLKKGRVAAVLADLVGWKLIAKKGDRYALTRAGRAWH